MLSLGLDSEKDRCGEGRSYKSPQTGRLGLTGQPPAEPGPEFKPLDSLSIAPPGHKESIRRRAVTPQAPQRGGATLPHCHAPLVCEEVWRAAMRLWGYQRALWASENDPVSWCCTAKGSLLGSTLHLPWATRRPMFSAESPSLN